MDTYQQLNVPAQIELTELAALSVADLVDLRQWEGDSCVVSAKTTAFMASRKSIMSLNFADLTNINKAIMNLKLGKNVTGKSFEEAALPCGSQVTFTKEQIILTDKTGSVSTIGNVPLPALEVGQTKPGQDLIHPFIVSHFDMKKGALVQIRAVEALSERYDGGTQFNPAGLAQVERILVAIIKTQPQMRDAFKVSKTLKGLSFSDLLAGVFCSCSMTDWFSLNSTIVRHCFRNFSLVKKADGTCSYNVTNLKKPKMDGSIEITPAMPKGTISVFTEKNTLYLEAIRDFKSKAGHFPIMWEKGLPSLIKWTTTAQADAARVCVDYRKMIALVGGKKRGIGKVLTYMSYCPRQSEVFRLVNDLIFLAASAHRMDKEMIDIFATPATVPLLQAYLSMDENAALAQKVMLVLSPQDSGTVKQDRVLYERRHGAHAVFSDNYTQVPDIQGTEKGKIDEVLTTAFKAWQRTVSIHASFSTIAPVFCDDFFAIKEEGNISWMPYHVFELSRAHDLRAVVTTEPFFVPVNSRMEKTQQKRTLKGEWWVKARQDMVKAIGWFLNPFPIFSDLGCFFRTKPELITWSDTDDTWQFTPTQEKTQRAPDIADSTVDLLTEESSTGTSTEYAKTSASNSSNNSSVDVGTEHITDVNYDMSDLLG